MAMIGGERASDELFTRRWRRIQAMRDHVAARMPKAAPALQEKVNRLGAGWDSVSAARFEAECDALEAEMAAATPGDPFVEPAESDAPKPDAPSPPPAADDDPAPAPKPRKSRKRA